jgi:hypothetical protein
MRYGQTCCGPRASSHSCGSGDPSSSSGGGRDAPLPVINKCCSAKDFGPVRDEEGPSEADIARFGSETIQCPRCRSEMYDEAEMCMRCGHIRGEADASGLPPWAVGVAVVLIGVVTLWFVI